MTARQAINHQTEEESPAQEGRAGSGGVLAPLKEALGGTGPSCFHSPDLPTDKVKPSLDCFRERDHLGPHRARVVEYNRSSVAGRFHSA